MNTDLFGRVWKVTVGVDDGSGAQNQGLDVSALDLDFKILRTLKSQPNQASLTLWNLNESHRSQILRRNQPAPKKLTGVPVTVEAGYPGQTSLLIDCDLGSVTSNREGLDWKTVLTGEDGGRAWREARINAQFAAGTAISDVARRCAQAMNIGLGNTDKQTLGVSIGGIGPTLPHPIALSGSASSQLTRVLGSVGLTWSIQNGVLQLLPKGTPLQLDAILITPKTGLVDSPQPSVDASVSFGSPKQLVASIGKKSFKQPKPKAPGLIKFKHLLIPGLVPARKVDVQTDYFDGGYMITEVLYEGSTWSQAWFATCTARAY